MQGLFSVYKPPGVSSYDIIRQLKKRFPGEKIGHGGTLDPFAEGILIIGVGRAATKKLGLFLGQSEKTYVATLVLGFMSTTDDPEGRKLRCAGAHLPSLADIGAALQQFQGEIWQTPPIYSALKVNGERAYALARRGETVTMTPRQVVISAIQCVGYEPPLVTIEVTCGSGTYIRSLARNIGKILVTGAYLTRLIRTRVRVIDQPELDFTLATTERLS